MDRLPADYLASFYVDVAGIAESAGTTSDLAGATTAGAVLVAEPGARLSGSVPVSTDHRLPSQRRSPAGCRKERWPR